MDDHLIAKEYKINPLAEGLMVGFSIWVVAMITTYFILHHSLRAEEQEIREGMLRQAKIIATLVDGDLHPSFKSPSQQESEEYQEAIRPLARALLESCDTRLSDFKDVFKPESGCSLIFIYTAILIDEDVFYVLDPWPPGVYSPEAPDIEMKSYIMDKYSDANPIMIDALLEEKAMTTQVFEDDWGHFISAYAPFYNSNEEFIGIVGIDMRADHYMERLKPIKRAAIRAFLAISIIAYVMGAAVWFLRRFTLIINTKRLSVIKAHNSVRQELDV